MGRGGGRGEGKEGGMQAKMHRQGYVADSTKGKNYRIMLVSVFILPDDASFRSNHRDHMIK